MYLQGVSTRKVAKVMIQNALPSLIAHPRYSDGSERPTSWKVLTDNSNAEQTLSPSSPLKLQLAAEALQAASSQPHPPAA
jgi:hypothetical protein